jgi:hypothetical protein
MPPIGSLSADVLLMLMNRSVLRMDKGTKVIEKGAPASFCGIILSGSFTVCINDTMSLTLRQGQVVGKHTLTILSLFSLIHMIVVLLQVKVVCLNLVIVRPTSLQHRWTLLSQVPCCLHSRTWQ